MHGETLKCVQSVHGLFEDTIVNLPGGAKRRQRSTAQKPRLRKKFKSTNSRIQNIISPNK